METQLQIYLIIGIGGGLLAALILSNSLLIYYVVKLYGKLSKKDEGWVIQEFYYHISSFMTNRSSPDLRSEQVNAYNNPAMNFDDELNRRFTQYSAEPTLQRETQKIQSNKGSVHSLK